MAVETITVVSDISKGIPASMPSGTHYTCLDESTLNTLDYVYGTWAEWTTDYYGVADHSVGSGTINKITMYGVFSQYGGGGGAHCNFGIKTGGTDYMNGGFQASSSPTLYSKEWSINPKTGVAWTWDDIDALQAIVSLSRVASSQYSFCYQIYIQVDYTEAAEGWTNIAKFSGATAADLAKVLGIAVADCSKISGVAV